ncbi:hypothetical protein B5S31_g2152 [[Candida] boidinii]|nr:hypothetical protein B5S29_g1839 [[Candida] boidinii]OWB72442.1 hypothetical protein B5S31_g2152 [[Candida] boidinii]
MKSIKHNSITKKGSNKNSSGGVKINNVFGGGSSDSDNDDGDVRDRTNDPFKRQNLKTLNDLNNKTAIKTHTSSKSITNLDVDSNLDYTYDEVYDNMKAADENYKKTKSMNDSEASKNLISNLSNAKIIRNLHKFENNEKIISQQREIDEKLGDGELKDKEVFVTDSYKNFKESAKSEIDTQRSKLKSTLTTGAGLSFHQRQLQEADERYNALASSIKYSTSVESSSSLSETVKDDLQYGSQSNHHISEKKESSEIQLVGGLNIVKKSAERHNDYKNDKLKSYGKYRSQHDNYQSNINSVKKENSEKKQKYLEKLKSVIASKLTEDDLKSFKERYLERKMLRQNLNVS